MLLPFLFLLAADTHVWIFTRTDCPIANRYAPHLAELSGKYGAVADFRLIYPEPGITQAKIDSHRKEYKLPMPGEPDAGLKRVKQFRAKVTPEAVVEHKGKVIYQGRIDDANAILGANRRPLHRDLEEVLQALRAGRVPAKRTTQAVGCAIESQPIAWIPLFDGVSSRGWLEITGKPFPERSWRVEDGCLRSLDPGDGIQDLRTEAEFGPDFEFEFEWKIAAQGNAGVKYFVQGIEEWTNQKGRQARARGLEFQLFDDSSGLTGDWRKLTGALYDVMAPAQLTAKSPGEFNHSRIRVWDGEAEHWVNGERVVTFPIHAPEVLAQLVKRTKGQEPKWRTVISLQNHGTPAWFRNLRARDLPNKP